MFRYLESMSFNCRFGNVIADGPDGESRFLCEVTVVTALKGTNVRLTNNQTGLKRNFPHDQDGLIWTLRVLAV